MGDIPGRGKDSPFFGRKDISVLGKDSPYYAGRKDIPGRGKDLPLFSGRKDSPIPGKDTPFFSGKDSAVSRRDIPFFNGKDNPALYGKDIRQFRDTSERHPVQEVRFGGRNDNSVTRHNPPV